MIYYFSAFAITLLFAFFAQKASNKRTKQVFRFLSFLPFTLISGFRAYNVGIDTRINYVPNYIIAVKYGDSIDFFNYFSKLYSFGFNVILFVMYRYFESPTSLLLVCSILINGFTFKAIYDQSKYPIISIIIYFLSGAFLLTMNGMRGYISFAMILYSLKYIKMRKLKEFLFFYIISSLIHPSVVVFIVLYPLYNFKLKKVHFFFILLTLPIMVLFGSDILYFFLRNTSFANYFAGKGLFINPLYTMIIINFILLLIFCINYNSHNDDKEYNFYLKLQLLSFIVSMMSFSLTQSYRVEQMIDFFQILTIPYNLLLIHKNSKITSTSKKFIYLCVIFLFVFYFTKVMILDDSNQVRDYISIFMR